MVEVIYLSKTQLADLVCRQLHFESVEFGHHDEFLPDESEGVIAFCENESGESEETLYYLDLRDVVVAYVDGLGLKFCGWRLFTRSEGLGAALLVKSR